ncbi:hypothetical protein [Rhodococcus spelaei]|uniref:hypothetical protein n=1 Tax=Rhodococcus spelaei TaxID=2546320 RepID=UPI003F49B2B7
MDIPRSTSGAVAAVAVTPALAADYIDRHLWTRSALTLSARRRLIAHALLRSAPSRGAAQLVLQVFRRTSVCAAWHSTVGHTTDELAAVLRDTVIDGVCLEQALGPHWRRAVEPLTATVEPSSEGIRCESGTDAQR